MSIPRVSVVMSVYNGERYLRQSVESVLGQSFGDFEFVIVNDGSKDNSRAILAEYERQDPRVRMLDQENQGLTKALIRGCSEARGEFIARQDADDWSHPERVSRCIGVLDASPDIVMASSWVEYVDPVGDTVETIRRPAAAKEATHGLLFERTGPPAHGSVIFRRSTYEATGGYRACFYYAQDSDLWLRMAAIGQIAYVQAYLYRCLLAPETISGVYGGVQWEFGELGQRCHAARLRGESEDAILAQAELLRARVLRGEFRASHSRRRRASANYRIGTSLSRRGNRRAKAYFWQAVRLYPFHWRSWCRLTYEILSRIPVRKAILSD